MRLLIEKVPDKRTDGGVPYCVICRQRLLLVLPIVKERRLKNAYSDSLSSYLMSRRYTDARKFISVKYGGINYFDQ